MPSPPHTTRVSTPSATHGAARSRASSASRPTRSRTSKPGSLSRGSAVAAGARPCPCRRSGWSGARSLGPRRETSRTGRASAARRRRSAAIVLGGPPRRPWPAGPAPRGRRSAVNAGAGHGQGQATVVLQEEDLAVPPGLVGRRADVVAGHRRGIGLVDGQEVARRGRRDPPGHPSASRRASPRGAAVRHPGHGDPCPATVRQVEGVSSGGLGVEGTARRRQGRGGLALLARRSRSRAITSETRNSDDHRHRQEAAWRTGRWTGWRPRRRRRRR